MNQEFISFEVSKEIAAYALFYVQDTAIRVAIAKAVASSVPTANTVTVTIHYTQVIQVFASLTVVPEGVAMEPNNELKALLTPYLADYPQLATGIAAIQERNQQTYEQVVAAGQQEIEKMATLLALN